jgi:hypothetical protein
MIFPLPENENGTATNTVQHKTKRRIRQLKNPTTSITPEIEPKYAAVPVRYVREAQKRKIESLYDEAWAVYDKDGHPHHSLAYSLAQEKPNVNIAFTSIAIEQWFLLHFDADHTPYDKSSKIPLGKYITDYVSKKKAKSDIYLKLKPNLYQAILNAAKLRVLHSGSNVPFYEKNPYANIDQLLFRMHGYRVIFPDDKFHISNIQFSVFYDSNNLVVQLLNNSHASLITDQVKFYTIASDGKQRVILFERERVSQTEEFHFCFDLNDHPHLYIDFSGETTVIDTTSIDKKPSLICA